MLFEQILEIDDPQPHTAPLNMALDEALLQQAVAPTLRIYGWQEPAVSLGYFSRYEDAQLVARNRAMVRRWTGGGLVEHGDDLTYTLIIPRTHAFFQINPAESYRLIHEQIAHWLVGQGIKASVAPVSSPEPSGACFTGHVRYDIVAASTKLAGAAQRRTRWGLLHQGSIQLVGNKNLANDSSSGATHLRATSSRPGGTKDSSRGVERSDTPGTRSLTRCTPEWVPESASSAHALNGHGLAEAFAAHSQRTPISSDLLHSATQIAGKKYATEEWLRKF